MLVLVNFNYLIRKASFDRKFAIDSIESEFVTTAYSKESGHIEIKMKISSMISFSPIDPKTLKSSLWQN